MKKINYSLVILVFISAIIISSCQKSDDVTNSNVDKMSFESFEKFGEIHNDFLTNVKQNFEPCDLIISYDEAIEYVEAFQQEFLTSISLTKKDKQMLSTALTGSKEFVDFDYAYNKMFPVHNSKPKSVSIDEMSLFELLEEAKALGVIDDFEFNSLLLLGDKVKQSYEGVISVYELESFALQIKDEWLAMGYAVDSENGRIMAYVLAISLASLEWWNDNPEGLKNSCLLKSTLAIPAWVAADIGGAIVGGVISGTGQAAIKGEVDWRVVGWSALGGGVATSTGAAKKIALLITRVNQAPMPSDHR